MQRDTSSKDKITQRLSRAIHKTRYILISLLGALVVLVIAWVIVSETRSKRIESSTILVESAEDKLNNWLAEEDTDAAAKLGGELVADLQHVLDHYAKLYAGQRALALLGQYYYKSDQWELSSDSFLKLAARFPKSYLAPVSIINAAEAMEEAGDPQKAIDIYKQVITKYSDTSPEIPRVLFSLGRLNETIDEKETALGYYNQLVDDYASSSWTNLAQDRIIYLNLD